jgi:lipoprotein-anchoring transpeptidase ErfK/SrfK
MNRHSSRRLSRALIGVLVVIVAIGGLFWFNKTRQSQAAAPKASDNPAAIGPVSAKGAENRPPPVITTINPNAPKPTTGPAGGNGGAAPNGQAAAPLPPAPTADFMVRAAALKDQGKLLEARAILNDALLSGKLPVEQAEQTKQQIQALNDTIIFSPKRFEADAFGGTTTVQPGQLLQKIAQSYDVPWEFLGRMNGLSDPRRLRANATIKVIKGPMHAVVYKGRYQLDVWLGQPGKPGSMFVRSFKVGLGANDSTPTGVWMCEPGGKLKNPTYYSARGEGVIAADDPKNPLGERWIALQGLEGNAMGKNSYGIHGTIEPQSIGTQASQGCIRLVEDDVELLFDMLKDGKSTVTVVD